MKRIIILLTISLGLCGSIRAQVTYTFYQFEYKPSTTTYYYTVAMPSDTAVNSNKRPVYIFLPGTGEIGDGKNTLANAVKYGYLRDLYLGLWNGGITQSNGYTDSVVYPIYVTLQSSGSSGSGGVDHQSIQYTGLKNRIGSKMDEDQIHVGGLSLGGRWVLMRISCASVSVAYRQFALLPASAFVSSPGTKSTSITDSTEQIGRWVNAGGRIAIMTGENDEPQRYKSGEIMALYNGIKSGSALGMDWKTGEYGFTGDGHCCWGVVFGWNKQWPWAGDKSIMNWQAQFTKAPKAVAQTAINTSTSVVTLNGVSNGAYRARSWTKISGKSATITNPNTDTTTVTGLHPGTYVFRFTVANTADERTATHDVTVTVDQETSPVGGMYLKSFPVLSKPRMY